MSLTIDDYKGNPITCEKDLDEMIFCPNDEEEKFLLELQYEFEDQDFELSKVEQFELDWEGYTEGQQDRWEEWSYNRMMKIFDLKYEEK